MEDSFNLKDRFDKIFKQNINESKEKKISLQVQETILKEILTQNEWDRLFNEKINSNNPHDVGENIINGVEQGDMILDTGFNLQRQITYTLEYYIIGIYKQGSSHDNKYDNYMENSFSVKNIEIKSLIIIDLTDDYIVTIQDNLINDFKKELNKFI